MVLREETEGWPCHVLWATVQTLIFLQAQGKPCRLLSRDLTDNPCGTGCKGQDTGRGWPPGHGECYGRVSSCGERRQIWDVCRQENHPWEGAERPQRKATPRIPAEPADPTPGEELVGGSETESSAGALPSSIPLLLSQTRQLADLQTQDTAGAAAGLTVRSPGTPFRASHAFPCLRPAHCPSFPQPVLQRLRRDTHIPICTFCCGCCFKATCGLCCRT